MAGTAPRQNALHGLPAFVDADGRIVTQIDREPLLPTPSWPISTTIDDPYALAVPLNAAPGTYQLLAGLYPTGDPTHRLPVVDVGKTARITASRLAQGIIVQP
jgi:hypothetical protein